MSLDLFSAYRHATQYLEALLTLEPERRLDKHGSVLATGPIGLKRCRRLLDWLGNPERKLHFIHVTGTSGKGSVVTQLHSILHEAGLRVGSHLSPHVSTTLERIAVGDGLLPPELFIATLERLKPFIEAEYQDGPYGLPTYQEVLFGMALAAFVELKVQIVALEVGIGGTLDTTNVIPPPLLAIITDVGLDHTEILGPDTATIARDKAGIFKPGSAALTGARRPEAWLEIHKRAEREHIPLWSLDREIHLETSGQTLKVHWPGGSLDGIQLEMTGAHQMRNAALSVAAAAHLRTGGLEIPDDAIRTGLARAFLPGRLEAVGLTRGGVLMLDMAHNVDKIEGLVDTWLSRYGRGGAAVVGVAADKDATAMLLTLSRAFSTLIVTRPLAVPRRMIPPRTLRKQARELGIDAHLRLDPRDAMKLALSLGEGKAAVTGSTYLVGEVRRMFQSEEDIVATRRIRRLAGHPLSELDGS